MTDPRRYTDAELELLWYERIFEEEHAIAYVRIERRMRVVRKMLARGDKVAPPAALVRISVGAEANPREEEP